MDCLFCNLDREILAENEAAYAALDGFAVSPGHTLIIPKRHVANIFELEEREYALCFELVREVKVILETQQSTKSFNVGTNCGVAAGQTISHAHIHLIPRYSGDVDDPRGGVRHVIPGKGFY